MAKTPFTICKIVTVLANRGAKLKLSKWMDGQWYNAIISHVVVKGRRGGGEEEGEGKKGKKDGRRGGMLLGLWNIMILVRFLWGS